MKKLLRKLFSSSSKEQAAQGPVYVQHSSFHPSQMLPNAANSPVAVQENADHGIRRQLVQVLLRDALRRHGIPAEWIELQMLAVTSSSRGAGMYLRLVLKHWDERLLCYLVPFENKFFADIKCFEPKASEWLHGISWQFMLDDACPYKTMPEKEFWTFDPGKTLALGPIASSAAMAAGAVETALKPQQDKQMDVMEDIERLFAIRDQELGLDSSSDDPASDFPPTDFQKTETQPSSGRTPFF